MKISNKEMNTRLNRTTQGRIKSLTLAQGTQEKLQRINLNRKLLNTLEKRKRVSLLYF
jgi:hypothetical protein